MNSRVWLFIINYSLNGIEHYLLIVNNIQLFSTKNWNNKNRNNKLSLIEKNIIHLMTKNFN